MRSRNKMLGILWFEHLARLCVPEFKENIYDHADIFAQAEPTQYQIALDILNSAKEYWEANNIPLKFLVINK